VQTRGALPTRLNMFKCYQTRPTHIRTPNMFRQALDSTVRGGLFRRRERRSIVVLVCLVWLSIFVSFWLGHHPKIDIDRAPLLSMRLSLDPNRATRPTLTTLPGIGPTLAKRIVELRQLEPYVTVQDLLKVRGIGPRKLVAIRPYLLPTSQWGPPQGD